MLLDYFRNYEGAFEGNVSRLQRDYFTLAAWLYFSDFSMRHALPCMLQDSDVIRYPSFAIVFGKSNCGKTSLVDTLMSSMFGYAHTVDKRSFTTAQLRGHLQHGYKRFPVVFDDIGRTAFNRHGRDMIKDELQPGVSEYPGFILSMNAEPQSFPDEVVIAQHDDIHDHRSAVPRGRIAPTVAGRDTEDAPRLDRPPVPALLGECHGPH